MRFIVSAAALLAAATMLAAPTGHADVQQVFDFYVHGLSLDGRISVNGTKIEKYRGGVSEEVRVDAAADLSSLPAGDFVDPLLDVLIERPQALWSALSVDEPDRFALRRDGLVRKNDARLYDLPSVGSPWLDLIARFGHTYAVRADGAVATDGAVTARHPAGQFHFRRVVRDLLHAYSLRSDGSIFRDDEAPMHFALRAGFDGLSTQTTWIAAAIDPTLDHVYALRADGVVKRGRLFNGELFGQRVTSLPFVAGQEPLLEQLYLDLVFTPDGHWYALTGDGRVYTSFSPDSPIVDLPGDPDDAGRIYTDLATLDGSVFALRSDGRVFEIGEPDPLCTLPSARYGSLALSRTAPVLTKTETNSPRAARIRTRTVVGTPLVLPVVAADVDTCTDDLVVTPTSLPAGAAWDVAQGAFVWPSPGATGNFAFRFEVTDGTNTRAFTYRATVKEADLDVDKNTRPLTPVFGTALAVAGQEFVLPVVVGDRDGDPLTVAVNPRRHPFTAGATFDPATRTFRWTPGAEDCGSTTVKFKVSDGGRPRIVSIRIRVKIGLFY